MTYQMKDKDSSSWPVNILDQLEVIWPKMRPQMTSRTTKMKDNDSSSWPVSILDQPNLAMTENAILDDHKIKCFITNVEWHIKWKIMTSVVVVYLSGQLEVSLPRYDQNCDLRWPPWPQNECFIGPDEWHIKYKRMTPVIDLSTF